MKVEVFSNEFTILYTQEIDYEQLTEAEDKAFEELCQVTGRFSPFEEDLANWNCYYSAAQVHDKALEALVRVSKDA